MVLGLGQGGRFTVCETATKASTLRLVYVCMECVVDAGKLECL